ncbi:MAG: CoA transferase [Actinomycetia bacterium]|nr:CoA transferase [Actinomycetes bacterium]MCP5030670.1 CoA transferase [Actinomycetes bacterium]
MAAALEGITVLDLSQGAAGPTCAMYLGDLGAEVVKVEPPGGEWGRGLGPPFVEGIAAAFLGMNRSKRSIVVDLKQDGGAEVLLRLAERCDVVLESFRPGVADRLGVGYEAMAARNPRVVYCAISAFGQVGSWRLRPGVDGIAQAMSGIMSVTGTADGPPVKVGTPAADMVGGVFATQAILAALFARERTGLGQRADVSLLESLLALQLVPMSMYLSSGDQPQRLGSAAAYAAPNEAFTTSDGHVMVAAYTPKRWPALCQVLGRPELATDPRFDTNEKRVRERPALNEVLGPLFATRTTDEWIAELEEADILCGPLLSYEQLLAEPHIAEAGSLVTVEHPMVGPVTAPGCPSRLSLDERAPVRPPPPIPGEHTREVLTELGFDAHEIDELATHGVVVPPENPNGDTAEQGART